MSQEPAKKIRQCKWLIPPLTTDVHSELHKAVPIVPILSFNTMNQIERRFEPHPGDYVNSARALIDSVANTIYRSNISPLEVKLGELMIRSIADQIDFLLDGLVQGLTDGEI